jgi:GTP-binding protein
MIDSVKIKIQAGKGGDGAVSFYKLLNMRYGKPDGGDGGLGGNVYIESSGAVFDLESFRGKNVLVAKDGVNGGRNQKKGKDAEDLVIKVPVGTIANLKINEDFLLNEKNRILAEGRKSRYKKRDLENFNSEYQFDFKKEGERILAAKGGFGGKGNMHAVKKADKKGQKANHWDSFNRAEKGRNGEIVDVFLELKTLAQIGIIGLPNAGKSTFLASVTRARPKIADYPFTTLEPNLGMMNGLVLADIPGIIGGAAKGKGLGLTFLKHIERTNLLLHLLDASENDIKGSYNIVRGELKYYGNGLENKQEIIAVNKTDLISIKEINKIKKMFGRKKVFFISARNGTGLEELKEMLTRTAIV